MEVHTNIPLRNYTTMRLGGSARYMVDITSADSIPILYREASSRGVRVFVLGGGSNTIARDEGFDGIVARIRIPGFEVIADEPGSTTIKVGAGEIWDEVVARTVQMRLSGIAAMSAIPGTAGAAPVQNVGAYGQEIADTLISLEAYDTLESAFVTLSAEECQFAYRDSIFRSEALGRFIITSITLQLSKNPPMPPFYEALQRYLDEHQQTVYTPQVIRDAVIAIRASKLPDPSILPNTGSFFSNAIIEDWQLQPLLETYPDMPHYDMGEGKHKVPTGWLIDQTGLKGELLHGIRVYDKNALVLVNESAGGYYDLAAARAEIIDRVRDTFGIMIQQEPLELA